MKILTTMNVHYSEANGKNVMTCGAYFRMEDDDCFPADFKEKIVNFIKKQQIHDGMFFVQGIRHKGRACLTESAARLDGGGFWNVFSKMTEFDIIGDLVDFARGAESKIDFRTYDYSLRGKCYFEYGIVIRAGLIKEVIGIDEIRKDPEIQVIFNRMLPGAEIKASGDMGQIGCYINMTAKDRDSLIEKVKFINDTVKVICDDGENHAIYFDKYDQLIACD